MGVVYSSFNGVINVLYGDYGEKQTVEGDEVESKWSHNEPDNTHDDSQTFWIYSLNNGIENYPKILSAVWIGSALNAAMKEDGVDPTKTTAEQEKHLLDEFDYYPILYATESFSMIHNCAILKLRKEARDFVSIGSDVLSDLIDTGDIKVDEYNFVKDYSPNAKDATNGQINLYVQINDDKTGFYRSGDSYSMGGEDDFEDEDADEDAGEEAFTGTLQETERVINTEDSPIISHVEDDPLKGKTRFRNVNRQMIYDSRDLSIKFRTKYVSDCGNYTHYAKMSGGKIGWQFSQSSRHGFAICKLFQEKHGKPNKVVKKFYPCDFYIANGTKDLNFRTCKFPPVKKIKYTYIVWLHSMQIVGNGISVTNSDAGLRSAPSYDLRDYKKSIEYPDYHLSLSEIKELETNNTKITDYVIFTLPIKYDTFGKLCTVPKTTATAVSLPHGVGPDATLEFPKEVMYNVKDIDYVVAENAPKIYKIFRSTAGDALYVKGELQGNCPAVDGAQYNTLQTKGSMSGMNLMDDQDGTIVGSHNGWLFIPKGSEKLLTDEKTDTATTVDAEEVKDSEVSKDSKESKESTESKKKEKQLMIIRNHHTRMDSPMVQKMFRARSIAYWNMLGSCEYYAKKAFTMQNAFYAGAVVVIANESVKRVDLPVLVSNLQKYING